MSRSFVLWHQYTVALFHVNSLKPGREWLSKWNYEEWVGTIYICKCKSRRCIPDQMEQSHFAMGKTFTNFLGYFSLGTNMWYGRCKIWHRFSFLSWYPDICLALMLIMSNFCRFSFLKELLSSNQITSRIHFFILITWYKVFISGCSFCEAPMVESPAQMTPTCWDMDENEFRESRWRSLLKNEELLKICYIIRGKMSGFWWCWQKPFCLRSSNQWILSWILLLPLCEK